jgi:hypothetical protein
MPSWRRGLFGAVTWSLALAPGGPIPADRPAIVIAAAGSPVWLDPQRALFFDAPSILLVVRNEHTEPVNYHLRIWIFDDRSHLKGTVGYCTEHLLDRATRARVFVPLDMRGVTLRDRAVVSVVRAASARRSWRLQQTDSEQLAAAEAAATGLRAQLSFERSDMAVEWQCPPEPVAQPRMPAQIWRADLPVALTFRAGPHVRGGSGER